MHFVRLLPCNVQDDWEEEDSEPDEKKPAAVVPPRKKKSVKQKIAEKEEEERRCRELHLDVSIGLRERAKPGASMDGRTPTKFSKTIVDLSTLLWATGSTWSFSSL